MPDSDSDDDGAQERRWSAVAAAASSAAPATGAAGAAAGAATAPPLKDLSALRDLPCIFWDQEDIERAVREGNPPADLVAMQSMLYDDVTPDELAERMKNKGNDALRLAGKVAKTSRRKARTQYRQAASLYTEALAANSPDAAHNAIYYSNRAHVHLLLGNSGKALADCLSAIRLNGGNAKVHYRAARAAADLARHDVALQHCADGLALEPDNADIVRVRDDVQAKAAAKQAREDRLAAARAKAESLADAIAARGVRVGGMPGSSYGQENVPRLEPPPPDAGPARPAGSAGGAAGAGPSGGARPGGGVLHWPVLILYGESLHSDLLKDVSEDDPLDPHLDEMFGPEAPPLTWDNRGAYTRSSVELYYEAHASIPLTPPQLARRLLRGTEAEAPSGGDEGGGVARRGAAPQWVRVRTGVPLGEVLREAGHVVPGIPVFYVAAAGTDFRDKMLGGDWSPPT